ncbi:AP2-like ethylene-responsive transcription factor AIL5 [Senna tora]|uniref:AP2-like ethylene-responsive transcription factor AIL5 n=1 Tax=Senna tora TaxID=362788 RepID=A0A835CGK6_9FABA|nr:AP2-like ethylene-responsive transcription factor AIL5 [Senna tora]
MKTIPPSFLQQAPPPKQTTVVPPSPKKASDTFGQRTSIYRGVTRLLSLRIDGRGDMKLIYGITAAEERGKVGKEGKILIYMLFLLFARVVPDESSSLLADPWGAFMVSSVYLGGYDKEEKAARAYDLAALKYWGPTTTTNFPISNYEKELQDMNNMTRQEFVASLRRKSSGFSRGASIYRGVTRHHQHGRWQARIGRVAGNKDLYLGTFSTQEEAAEAYDIAAIKFRGLNAVTNFDMSRYDVKSIANTNLPIGGFSSKSDNNNNNNNSSLLLPDKELSTTSQVASSTSNLSFAIPIIKQDPNNYCSNILLGYPSSLKNYNSSSSSSSATLQSYSNDSVIISNTSLALVDGSGVYVEQQQSGSNSISSSVGSASALPIGINSYNERGYGNWSSSIGPALHTTFQTHATSSVFQTPIFGME